MAKVKEPKTDKESLEKVYLGKRVSFEGDPGEGELKGTVVAIGLEGEIITHADNTKEGLDYYLNEDEITIIEDEESEVTEEDVEEEIIEEEEPEVTEEEDEVGVEDEEEIIEEETPPKPKKKAESKPKEETSEPKAVAKKKGTPEVVKSPPAKKEVFSRGQYLAKLFLKGGGKTDFLTEKLEEKYPNVAESSHRQLIRESGMFSVYMGVMEARDNGYFLKKK